MNIYTATEQAYKNGYVKGCEDSKKENKFFPCNMCDNAKLNEELTDNNDFSSYVVGSFDRDCRIMLASGMGRPLRIDIDKWDDNENQWKSIGVYYPKFCPECGRKIEEYK